MNMRIKVQFNWFTYFKNITVIKTYEISRLSTIIINTVVSIKSDKVYISTYKTKIMDPILYGLGSLIQLN